MSMGKITDYGDLVRLVFEPLSVEEFISDYWQRKFVVLDGRSTNHFDSVLTIDDIDRIVSECSIPSGNIDIGEDAIGVEAGDYKPNGFANPCDVLRLHASGKTIILRGMHNWSAGVRQLCSAISSVFSCPSQANVYLTPAGTRSSYPHWDAHDIFVIQLQGRKTWTIHENALRLPHPGFRFDPAQHPIGDPVDEFVVEAGQTAYIPRGLAHNPSADEYSVHISLGVQVFTWYDLLIDLLDNLCVTNLPLREALPNLPEGRGLDINAMAQGIPDLMADSVTESALQASAMRLLRRATAGPAASNASGLLSMIANGGLSVDLETQVELRGVLPSREACSVDTGTDRLVLNGVELELTTQYSAMARLAANHRRFQVKELPGKDAEKIAFVERLVREGCFRLV